MTILVSYDVSDDRRRAHLSAALLDYGSRVQESVFWIDAEEDIIPRMRSRITQIAAPEDSIWLVPVCAGCAGKIETLGIARRPVLPEFWVL